MEAFVSGLLLRLVGVFWVLLLSFLCCAVVLVVFSRFGFGFCGGLCAGDFVVWFCGLSFRLVFVWFWLLLLFYTGIFCWFGGLWCLWVVTFVFCAGCVLISLCVEFGFGVFC